MDISRIPEMLHAVSSIYPFGSDILICIKTDNETVNRVYNEYVLIDWDASKHRDDVSSVVVRIPYLGGVLFTTKELDGKIVKANNEV